jgi:hypothetical protein
MTICGGKTALASNLQHNKGRYSKTYLALN